MLSSRLAALAQQIPIGAKIADIGTDHGLMPVYLGKNGVSDRIIATDISSDSLRKASILIDKENLQDIIETRIGPGLKVIKPGEVDTVVIAGMGGLLISSILDEGAKTLGAVRRLILQPMNNTELVREWLVNNGFAIEDESLVKEGRHIYEIIVSRLGYQGVSDDIYFEVGFKFIENRDPLFQEFLAIKIRKTKAIISKLEKQNTENARNAMVGFSTKLKKYDEVLECFARWEG
ncbi:MAG TPA: class I SAM-dependent methyltransferase [Clostridia bacterium]|nr:class I SAM-dependent methyltransferase [Clostridia bacterium]